MRRWYLLLVLLLAACAPDAIHGEDELETGDQLYSIDFESDDAFPLPSYPDVEATFEIADGTYRIQHAANRANYIWAQGGDAAQDVIIEVQAEVLSSYSNNLYGLMCRVDEDGSGYAFLVSSDGFAGIARAENARLSFLADWTANDAVNEGQAINNMRAVCIDDYLALYVNGEFVLDAEDSTFSGSGEVGLIAGVLVETSGENTSEEIVVNFDDLTVSEGALR